MIDMHKLFPKIHEVMEFQKCLIVKLILRKLGCIALFGSLKQTLPQLQIFCVFSHLYSKLSGTISHLDVWSNSTLIKSQNSLTEPISPD
jgi:hypothetical protein